MISLVKFIVIVRNCITAQSKARVRAMSLINFGSSHAEQNPRKSRDRANSPFDFSTCSTSSNQRKKSLCANSCSESRCRKLLRSIRRGKSNKSLSEILLLNGLQVSSNQSRGSDLSSSPTEKSTIFKQSDRSHTSHRSNKYEQR